MQITEFGQVRTCICGDDNWVEEEVGDGGLAAFLLCGDCFRWSLDMPILSHDSVWTRADEADAEGA
jgi:hypothetical protein